MEPGTLAAIAAIIGRWGRGNGLPRLGAPPVILCLPAPAGWVPAPPEVIVAEPAASPVAAAAAPHDVPASERPVPTAPRSVLFRRRTAMAEAARAKKLQKQQSDETPRADAPASDVPDPAVAKRETGEKASTQTPDAGDSPSSARRDDPHAGMTLQRTIQSPDPWSIMPSRTLRGAGATHLQRRSDPLVEPETLSERVAQEGPEAPPPTATVDRWNLLIVPSQPGFRASDQGVKALVLYLDRSQLLRSPMVSTLEEFVGHALHAPEEYWRSRLHGGDVDDDAQIISLDPGVFAHQLFYEGPAPSGGAPILAAHIGHRARSTDVPFGSTDRKAAFWLALIGCRFDKVSRGFLERMHSILYLRPQVLVAPYTGPTPDDAP